MGQIKAKGVAASEEIGKQLTNAGIPAWQMLAKGLNTDVAGAMALVKSRAVDANTAIRILLGGMDEMYGGMMEKQSRSFEGLQSTLTDVFRIFTRKAGASLFEGIKVDMGKLVDFGSGPQLDQFLDRVAPKITDFTMAIYRSTKAIGEFLVRNREIIIVLAEFGAAALIAGKAYSVFSKLNAAVGTFKQLGLAIGGLNPAGILAAAAIGGLAVVFADATAKGLTLNEALEDMMANLDGLGSPNLQLKDAKKFDDQLDSVSKELDAIRKRRLGSVNDELPPEAPEKKDAITEAGDKASEQYRTDATRTAELAEAQHRKAREMEDKADELEEKAKAARADQASMSSKPKAALNFITKWTGGDLLGSFVRKQKGYAPSEQPRTAEELDAEAANLRSQANVARIARKRLFIESKDNEIAAAKAREGAESTARAEIRERNGPTKEEIQQAGLSASEPFYRKGGELNDAMKAQDKVTSETVGQASQASYEKALKLASDRDAQYEAGDEAAKKAMSEMRGQTPGGKNRKAIASEATGIWDQLKAIAAAAQPKLQDAAIAGRADLEARQEALGLSPGTAKRNAKKKKEEDDEIKRVATLRGVDPAVVRNRSRPGTKKTGLR